MTSRYVVESQLVAGVCEHSFHATLGSAMVMCDSLLGHDPLRRWVVRDRQENTIVWSGRSVIDPLQDSRTACRYFLLKHGDNGLADVGRYDDPEVARAAAHAMSLADRFGVYAVFDRVERKIISPWSGMPANSNDRRTA